LEPDENYSPPYKNAAELLASLPPAPPARASSVEGQRRDSKSSQRRDSKLIASPDKARGTAAAFEVHGEKWGHGGKPGNGVWKQPQFHAEHAEAVQNNVMCCLYCNDNDPRVCVVSPKGLCVPNLGSMGGKLIWCAIAIGVVLGLLVFRTRSMHLKEDPDPNAFASSVAP